MFGKAQRDTSHGSAAWLSPEELSSSTLIKSEGTPLAIGATSLAGRMSGRMQLGEIRHAGDQHHLIVAGSGGGKFISSLAPSLVDMLHTPCGSAVVIDPKGEALGSCGKLFMGTTRQSHDVVWLDPWNEQGTGKSWRFNFLDQLTPSNPNLVDDARALADAIIIPSGGDTHWDTTARNLLTALLLYISVHPAEEGRRHLVRLREIAAFTETQWLELAALLEDSPLCEGAIKREINAHRARNERERSSIVSTIARDTAWLDSPQIRRAVVSDNVRRFPVRLRAVDGTEVPMDLEPAENDGYDLDPVKIATGKTLVFVVIPPQYFMTHRSWLRLCVTAFGNAFKMHRPRDPRAPSTRRHIFIDEFASLGAMSAVETAVAVERGYGIQYHLYVQSFGQLERQYAKNWQTFIANCTLQAFSINDLQTAEYLSKKCGVTTVATTSSSTSSSTDLFQALRVSRSTQESTGTSGRPLVTADEIMSLPPDLQLIFMQNMRPILALKHDFRRYAASSPGEVSLRDIWRDDLGGVLRQMLETENVTRRLAPALSEQTTEAGRNALQAMISTPGPRGARGKYAAFAMWFGKMALQKLMLAILFFFCTLLFWGFVIGWMATGSALESAKHGVIFLLSIVVSPLRWLAELWKIAEQYEVLNLIAALLITLVMTGMLIEGVSKAWAWTGLGRRLDSRFLARYGEPYVTFRVWTIRTEPEAYLFWGALIGAGVGALYYKVYMGSELTWFGHISGLGLILAFVVCLGSLIRDLWRLRQWLRRRNLPEDLQSTLVQYFGPK